MTPFSWRARPPMLLLVLSVAACTGNAHTCYKPIEAGTEAGQILVAVPCPEPATAPRVLRGYTK